MSRLFILPSLILLTTLGCSNIANFREAKIKPENGEVIKETLPDRKGSIVEIPKLVTLSKKEIVETLGEPKRSKTNWMEFSISQGDATLDIDWKNEKISRIRLELKTTRDSSTDVLKAGGFVLENEKPDWENAIVKNYKNRVFNGIRFSEISVGMHPPTKKWDDLRIDVLDFMDQ